MYDLDDSIAAVSSPSTDKRVIVRVTGADTRDVLGRVCDFSSLPKKAGVLDVTIKIDDQLTIDAKLYLFLAPNSYTGDDLAELHTYTNPSVIECLMGKLLSCGLRLAGPGEFTARAYLNGKIDLAQAEAVNEIVLSSNRYQLSAAEKLLGGHLAQTINELARDLMDCLGLIEAGLDFSDEDIEFITTEKAIERLTAIAKSLQSLLDSSIDYETVIDLPSVGIAGSPNAGKSSLLNKLLGTQRSIVSEQRKTTRDVLSGSWQLENGRCVLFDCAGLIVKPNTILDELAQSAATEALTNAAISVFCVDISKEDFTEDIAIRELIETENIIAVATKTDLLSKDQLKDKLNKLSEIFAGTFMAISSETGSGLQHLTETIDKQLIGLGGGESNSQIALTARHKHAIGQATAELTGACHHLKDANDEIAAMGLRTAYQWISNIQQHNIDERILDNIFSRFCIGK